MTGKYAGLLSCILIAVQASFPLPSNFSNWGWLSCKKASMDRLLLSQTNCQAIVVGNYLYIDGGEYYTHDRLDNVKRESLRFHQLIVGA